MTGLRTNSSSLLEEESPKISSLLKAISPQVEKATSLQTQNPFWSGVDPLELAYLMIYQAVEINHDTTKTQAKALAENAKEQNLMINKEAEMNFVTLTWNQLHRRAKINYFIFNDPNNYKWVDKNPSQGVLDGMTSKNQEISAIRGVMEDKINVAKQNASVQETNLNSTSDASQQAVSQGSSIMNMLMSLTSQIARI